MDRLINILLIIVGIIVALLLTYIIVENISYSFGDDIEYEHYK